MPILDQQVVVVSPPLLPRYKQTHGQDEDSPFDADSSQMTLLPLIPPPASTLSHKPLKYRRRRPFSISIISTLTLSNPLMARTSGRSPEFLHRPPNSFPRILTLVPSHNFSKLKLLGVGNVNTSAEGRFNFYSSCSSLFRPVFLCSVFQSHQPTVFRYVRRVALFTVPP